MTRPRGLWHGLGLVLLLLLVTVPSTADAATTVTTFHASPYYDARLTPPAQPPVTIGAEAVVHFGAAPGYAAAGTQGTSPGLQGTTVVLATCIGACTDRYRPASSAAIVAGDYAERVIFTVTQPGDAGPAVGFDVDVGVHTTAGWVFGVGYLSTGVAGTAPTSTVTLRLYVVLGTTAPTIDAVEVTVNRCSATTGCP